MESRRLIPPALLYSKMKDIMTKITINKRDFQIADCSEADGIIAGTCDDYLELKLEAKDGSPISVEGESRGKITYSWFPISGHFQIFT